MKNKKNIFLLVAVLVIWGLLIYKFVDSISPESNNLAVFSKPTFKPPVVKSKDTFSIQPISRDPFLGTILSTSKSSNVTSKVKKQPTDQVAWPSIEYHGLVADVSSKNRVFIIKINGNQQLLSNGSNFEELKIIRGDAKKVMIRFNGTIKEFTLQK